jgi:nucleotide sugar dehydrogenase
MGLPLACAFASHGADVTACDVNDSIVDSINAGVCPFDEPGVNELLKKAVSEGLLRATTATELAVSCSDVVVVIVPVLLTTDNKADLHTIQSVTRIIGASIKPGTLVSYETTLPVGTTRRFGAMIEAASGLMAGIDFHLVFSPERVKSQRVLQRLFQNPKVVGGVNPDSARRGAEFYTRFLGAPVHNVKTLEAAEFVKLAGMIYRDVNIALANELAAYAELVGVDYWQLLAATNSDGEAALLSPGIGVGGHCTPVYPHFLINDAREKGQPTALAECARNRNYAQPGLVIDRLGDVDGKLVTILGVGFRPQVRETAYSPAFALRDALRSKGAIVRAHDPLYSSDELLSLGFEPAELEGSDILVLNTAHDMYTKLDFAALAASGVRTVVDGRNAWNSSEVTAAGLRYIGIGK